MKNRFTQGIVAMAFLLLGFHASAQTDVYSVTSGELIFQWADLSFTPEYMDANPNNTQVGNPLRFTAWFHLGQYVHMDFTDNLGLYTGVAVRNVGLISNENLDIYYPDEGITRNEPFKIIRRTYNLGVPLALKIGSFNNHFYFFGGAEIEWAYVYKEKYWNSHSRDGDKNKGITWFGSQTPALMPSVFAGVQLPGGVNLKFKYYLNNYLNNEYTSKNKISDLTRYESSQVMYISMSWQFKTKEMKKSFEKEDKMTSL